MRPFALYKEGQQQAVRKKAWKFDRFERKNGSNISAKAVGQTGRCDIGYILNKTLCVCSPDQCLLKKKRKVAALVNWRQGLGFCLKKLTFSAKTDVWCPFLYRRGRGEVNDLGHDIKKPRIFQCSPKHEEDAKESRAGWVGARKNAILSSACRLNCIFVDSTANLSA